MKYGKAAKKQIRYNVDYYINLWGRICDMTEREVLKKASSTAEPIKKYDAGIYEEIEGIAEGSGSKLEEILALNTRYELLFSQVKLAPDGCTALAALPDATTVGHTLLAQNWDYRPGIKDGCVTLEVKQEGKPSILLHAEAGTVGHKGVNSHGLGIVVNALVSDKDSFTPPHPAARAVQEGVEQPRAERGDVRRPEREEERLLQPHPRTGGGRRRRPRDEPPRHLDHGPRERIHSSHKPLHRAQKSIRPGHLRLPDTQHDLQTKQDERRVEEMGRPNKRRRDQGDAQGPLR